ncbi:MAG: site-specific integrase [Mycobacteriales bacterium]
MATTRKRLPPGTKWITLPSGARRVELVLDAGVYPATGKRRQVKRRLRTVEEACAEYARIRSTATAGSYVSRSRVTVEQVAAQWLAGRRVRPSTAAGYRDSLKPVLAAYGGKAIQGLDKGDIDRLMTSLLDGAGRRRAWRPRTVNLMLTVLSMMLDDATRQGLVVRNVAQLVDRVPQSRKEMQTFTAPEVRTVLDAAGADRMEVTWRLALSGLRRGEVCGLRWDAVDLAAKTLTIRETRVSVDGHVASSAPKTERGRRILPLTAPLLDALRRARKMQAAERLALGAAYVDSGYVVVDEAGRPLHPDTVSVRWAALLRRAGVRSIRLHDARHTCGTLMHLDGVPVAVIAAWLGHADGAFTMRTYVHSQDDALRHAAERLTIVTSA